MFLMVCRSLELVISVEVVTDECGQILRTFCVSIHSCVNEKNGTIVRASEFNVK